MKKRIKKPKKVFRVYCTYYPTGEYYIGFSTKDDKQYEKYFGSSRVILELLKEHPKDHGLKKETIATFEKRSHARMQEFLLQWQQRDDEKCLNDMINIRLRMSHLKDFTPLECWIPKIPD